MTGRDYSQSGEQEIILAWASERPSGMFLDLGAGDGETFSNTRSLHERLGWDGVCVEAAPWAFERLAALYEHTDVWCANVAVTPDQAGLVDFHYVKDDHLSSLKGGYAERWKVTPVTFTVMACPLHLILDHFFRTYAFVSIDTEGSSVEILRALRRHRAWEDVRMVCVEAEDAVERAEVEQACTGFELVAVTSNNVLMALP